MEVNFTGKNWELSPYELHREPQQVITDATEIAVSPRSLHSELMCPICLDMLKTTMTTKECLHRFCQDCIITALRSGNKECPTCRKKLISKRSLRHDPNFDALIQKIYPSRDEYEAQQERVLAKVNKQHFVQNIEESLRMQALSRARGKKHSASDEEGHMNKRLKTTNGSVSDSAEQDVEEVQELELIVKPLPQIDQKDPSLSVTRYMKTAVTATIDHIALYLKMRYEYEGSEDEQGERQNGSSAHGSREGGENKAQQSPFTMYIAAGVAQYHPLHGDMSLADVAAQHWKFNRPLELYYGYKVNPTS